MSQNTAFSMNELELESPELLPARETLCAVKCSHGSHGSTTTTVVTQQDGNTAQVGLINVSLLNGNFDNIW
jgi:hypothetical protein